MTTAMPLKPQLICLRSTVLNVRDLAEDIYERTCRTNFESPGFCLLNLGESISSSEFRQVMVDLKNQMSAIHQRIWNEVLVYVSLARFYQLEFTKPHLDGGPDECILMLGYEPSPTISQIEITDHAKCAFELGLTPKQLLAKHNPMFKAEADLIRPYVTRGRRATGTDGLRGHRVTGTQHFAKGTDCYSGILGGDTALCYGY